MLARGSSQDYHSHFLDEEAEAQQGGGTWRKVRTGAWWNRALHAALPGSPSLTALCAGSLSSQLLPNRNLLAFLLLGQLFLYWPTSSTDAFSTESITVGRKPARNIWVDMADPLWACEGLSKGMRKYFQCHVFLSGTDTPHRLAWIISNSLRPPSVWKCLVVFPRVQKSLSFMPANLPIPHAAANLWLPPGEGTEGRGPWGRGAISGACGHPGVMLAQTSELRPSWLSRMTVLSTVPVEPKERHTLSAKKQVSRL